MNNRFSHILLDLDGTLIRSDAGIIHSVEYALAGMGRPSPGRERLLGFVGPPLEVSFRDICGLEGGQIDEAITLYRRRYAVEGIRENELYEGIEDLLKALAEQGYKLHLATSKPLPYARQILDIFDVSKYFSSMHGSSLDSRDQTKGRIIGEALADGDIPAAGALMVGDRHHDIDGAKENGLASAGVLYGYGSRREMEAAGADWILPDVPALARFLLEGDADG